MAIHPAPVSSSSRALALRKRPDLVERLLYFGRRRHWVVKDPLTWRFFQLRDEEHEVLSALDGTASLDSIRRRLEARFAPRLVSIEQVQQFIERLHADGLVVADAPDQAEALLKRRRGRRRWKLVETLANPLAIRFRGIDPHAALERLYPWCRWMFSPWVLAGCVLLVLAALALVVVEFDVVRRRAPALAAWLTPRSALWLLATLAVTKVIHELGHALAARHFGGRCHELGVMLLVFTPCLYCNVSDAWLFADKWRRAAVGAAGIAVELVLAAACTFLWWFSQPGLFNLLCFNVMTVCSIGTVLFNGNPLLRYDGYYILCDLLQTPNLGPRSDACMRRWLARRLWGWDSPSAGDLQHPSAWLLAYSAASHAYRLGLIAVILWGVSRMLVAQRLDAAAAALVGVVVGGVAVGPAIRAGRLLADPRTRPPFRGGRAAAGWLAVLAAAAAVLAVPLPCRIVEPVVVEPRDARAVYVSVPGMLFDAVPPGAIVRRGQALARLENLDLSKQAAQLAGRASRQQRHVRSLETRSLTDDSARLLLPAARQTLADLLSQQRQLQRDLTRLTLTAPTDGVVLPPTSQHRPPHEIPNGWRGTPLDESNRGAWLNTGTLLCRVGDPQRLDALIVVDQVNVQRLAVGQAVTMRFASSGRQTLQGTIGEIAQRDLQVAPANLAAAGRLAVRPDVSGRTRPATTSYQVRVALDRTPPDLLPGATGLARIELPPQSLARRLLRYASHTFRVELYAPPAAR